MKKLYQATSLLAVVVTGILPALAQSERATINGRVTDASGAVIAEADIKVISLSTGISFNTKTNGEGYYTTAATLKPGSYQVEVTHSGFRKALSQEIVVQIGDVKEVNFALDVGAVGEQVTVTATSPALETETSNRGEVITGREIVDLPLKDRN